MDFNELKTSVLSAAKRFIGQASSVRKLPYFKRYMLAALVLTLLFTLFTFPYEIIISRQIKQAGGKVFRSLSIGSMDINLLGESFIDNADITFRNGGSLFVKSLTADMSFMGFLNSKIKGSIMANNIAYTAALYGIKASANLSANIDLKLDKEGTFLTDGKILAICDNITINSQDFVLPGGFGLSLPPSIRISSVNLESDIANSLLTIKKLDVTGNDIRGNISGSIAIAPIFENSKLNLKISVDKDSEVLKEFAPFIVQFTDAGGKITISVTGTAANPRAELPKAMQNETPASI